MLLPAAYVIMQLSLPGVGYGVLERGFNLFATTGFLAPEFRAMMRLDWSASEQRRFEWLLIALRLADRLILHQVWIFGYRVYLWDMRFRARRGWRIV